LDIAAQKINSDTSLSHLPKVFRDFMFVMAQNYFFDSSSGLTVAELSNILGKSPATVRKMAKYLLDLSLVEQKGERPAYYGIAPKYFEQ
jgi:Fic family protein